MVFNVQHSLISLVQKPLLVLEFYAIALTFEYVPLTSFSGDSIIQFDETEKSEGNNDVQG